VTQALTQEATDLGWSSKAKWPGKAHYVLANGETACAKTSGPYGMLMGTLFKTKWAELNPNDHLCGRCAKAYPRECQCGQCRIKAAVASPFDPLPRVRRARGRRPTGPGQRLNVHVPLRMTEREREMLRTLSVRHPSGSINGYVRTLIRAAWRRHEKLRSPQATDTGHEAKEK
jgi:hypothetical protein